MNYYFKTFAAVLTVSFFLLLGCKPSMVISKVDYSQPIESVLEPNEEGMVNDQEHGLRFSMMPLQYAETQDTTSVTTSEIRYIRGQSGFYYVTAPTYKHVYLMSPEKSELKLEEKFKISEVGIDKPAFNQRDNYVQLVNRTTGERYRLTPEGMKKEEMATSNIDNQ